MQQAFSPVNLLYCCMQITSPFCFFQVPQWHSLLEASPRVLALAVLHHGLWGSKF